jgi:hypothetical protein
MIRPISQFPTKKIKVDPLLFFSKIGLFILIMLWSSLALLAIQLLSTMILTSQLPLWLIPHSKEKIQRLFYQQFRTVIRFTQRIFTVAVLVLIQCLLPKTKIHLSGDFESMAENQKSILISNHQIYPDCNVSLTRDLSLVSRAEI